MWMAHIGGYQSIQVFSEDKRKAKQEAVNIKKKICRDDLDKWNWEACKEYYGAWTVEIKEGTILYENMDI